MRIWRTSRSTGALLHVSSHFESLVDCLRVLVLMTPTDMLSGPICAMVWEGREAVKTGRSESHLRTKFFCGIWLTSFLALLGATNPMASAPGTIRGDYAIVRSLLLRRESLADEPRTSAAMFATAPMLSRAPRRRLTYGSTRKSYCHTSQPTSTGSTRSHEGR